MRICTQKKQRITNKHHIAFPKRVLLKTNLYICFPNIIITKRTMKRIHLFAVLLFLSCCAFAQPGKLTEKKLNMKLDSILVEGNLLFYYEKATWIAYDMALENPVIRNKFESYLTYQTGKAIKTIIIGKNLENCVAEYSFITDYDTPDIVQLTERELSTYEKKLIYMRERIMSQLGKDEYDLRIPEGYSLNFILLPYGKKYKLYVLAGTSQLNIIPFGNDYLFIADDYGNIERWRKFHTGLIPTQTEFEGSKVRELTHSHVKDNPLISATDICTFMLYAPLYDLERFSVYADGRYMTYDLESNSISVTDKKAP